MKCKQKEESGRRERRGRRERGRRGGDGLLWCSGRQESATKKSLRFQAFKVNKREYKYGGVGEPPLQSVAPQAQKAKESLT